MSIFLVYPNLCSFAHKLRIDPIKSCQTMPRDCDHFGSVIRYAAESLEGLTFSSSFAFTKETNRRAWALGQLGSLAGTKRLT